VGAESVFSDSAQIRRGPGIPAGYFSVLEYFPWPGLKNHYAISMVNRFSPDKSQKAVENCGSSIDGIKIHPLKSVPSKGFQGHPL
jgi:hypothetical protein